MDMPHALPARRHAAHGLRAPARGGRARPGWNPALVGKEQTHRGSQVRQLLQGGLPRQRHQGRAHLQRAVGHPAGLVPHQRDESGGAREGEPRRRLAPHAEPRHLHARPAGLAGGHRPRHQRPQARLVQGLHHRRQHQQEDQPVPVAAWTTRRSPTRPTRSSPRRASSTSASTRGSSRHPSSSSSRTSSPTRDVRDVGKAARTGRSSTSSSTTRPTASPAAAQPEDAWAQFEQTGRIDWVTRPRRDPGEVRRHERLRRPRPDLRARARWPIRA